MNCYEHTFITKQDLSDNQTKKLISKYEDIIKTNSGKVLKIEEWGLRNLSHRIKNNKKGFYFHIKFEGIGKTIEELEKVENIEIEAVTHRDAPVMGVLQWTIQGDVKGYSIKMGFDLI